MRSIKRSVLAAAVITGALAPAIASGADLQPRPWNQVDGTSSVSALENPSPDPTGLPAAQENIELVGELNPKGAASLNSTGVRNEEIADLAVHKGYAYLNSWDSSVACDRGGVYVVDIRNPAAPKEVSYIAPQQPYYHGEGAHVISVDTPAFKGDILAVNNETWGSNLANSCGPANKTRGGFDLYDVTDPANPKVLVRNAGDKDGNDADPNTNTAEGTSMHSVFLWQAGPKLYAVGSDNVELKDVDIFDVTDPTAPVQVGDYDLAAKFPQILANEKANGLSVFNHDMVVKQIDGKQIMSVSNWDSGYVQIDVTDPTNPTYVTDTTVTNDPFRPNLFDEGNAHQSEFSADNQFLLAADEDFSPFRSVLTGSTTNKSRTALEASGNPNRIADLPDGELDGQTVWAGDGCEGLAFTTPNVPNDPEFPTAPADDGNPDTDRIALVERGPTPAILTKPEGNPGATGADCGFAEKIDNAAAAGFDGIVIFNQQRPDDGQVNMNTVGIQDNVPATIPAVQMRRVDALGAEGAITSATTRGAHGTAGPNVSIATIFDGWGDAHLYDAKTSQLIDSYAVPESQDSRFSQGFGDLSIHEFATDPTEPVAYAAYYGAGLRTFRFSRTDGLVPTGKFIDDDGNGSNVWGVEVFTGADGERYVATSDRDFGLQIFRYTGAARAQRPVCEEESATTTAGGSVSVSVTCTDANDNPLAIRITDQPDNGTLTGVTRRATTATRTITYTPNAGFTGTDSFAYVANDGAADSAEKRVTVTVTAAQATPTPTPGAYYYNIKRKPGLTAFAKPKRDTKKPFIFRVQGKLVLPRQVSKAAGCKGTIRITAKKGKKTIAKRRTGVKSTCKYKARVKLRKSAGKRGTVKFKVEFLGNDRLTKATKTAKAKYGKKAKKRK